MYELAIKVENYKCFKEETGFDAIHRVNLIIGRNNAGKSSLLDIIEAVVSKNYTFDDSTRKENKQTKVIFESKITKPIINSVFHSNKTGGGIPTDHGYYGQGYDGRSFKWSKFLGDNKKATSEFIMCDDSGINPPLNQSGYEKELMLKMLIPLEDKTFRRLLAERDITPEKSSTSLHITKNGTGLTNVIQKFINGSNLPSDLVESSILNALNEIFAHDALFTDIVCQQHLDDNWEIYFEEKNKGRIALSKSGSGLKTVMSVLSCLILVPSIENTPLKDYIFGFEELENNIHPALLRRLNNYIYKSSIANDFSYFLTTHSNVLIDQFSKQKDAQIVHVTLENSIATCATANTYIINNGILDDLDVRASDLLQANGIIWVEGPSDRIYLNRWISLWSNDELKEGTHYQIIIYGGRLLSHLSADLPNDTQQAISILNTNRNAIMIIDSDKRAQQTKINETKLRIQAECEAIGALCWITQGKEIENYISSSVVDNFWGKSETKQVGKYESFFDHLDNIISNEGKKYSSKKPLLAEKLISHMTKTNMGDCLDIDSKMNDVINTIKSWNN